MNAEQQGKSMQDQKVRNKNLPHALEIPCKTGEHPEIEPFPDTHDFLRQLNINFFLLNQGRKPFFVSTEKDEKVFFGRGREQEAY